jgi:hypothetical protein
MTRTETAGRDSSPSIQAAGGRVIRYERWTSLLTDMTNRTDPAVSPAMFTATR